MVYFLCKAYDSGRQNCCFALSLPVRGAWVEITTCNAIRQGVLSLPVRGAWVEIPAVRIFPLVSGVAPRAGSVG